MKKDLIIHTFYIIGIFFAILVFLHQSKNEQIKKEYADTIKETRKQFTASQSAFDKLSHNYFNDHNDYISKIMYLAQQSDENKSTGLRKFLLDSLHFSYKNMSLFGLSQFQIHTKDGHSFLRFNRPDFFGDNLKSERESIRRITKNFRFIKGFEAGPTVEGLRYIYPLFYDGEYVGSYEWVWTHESLINELKQIYGTWNGIIVSRKKLRKTLQLNRIDKIYGSFPANRNCMFQKSAFSLYPAEFKDILGSLFYKENLCTRLKQKKDFSFLYEYKGNDYMITFITLKNIKKNVCGYFFSINKNSSIDEINKIFYLKITFSALVLILMYISYYHAHREKMFVRTLIDSQKDLVILTNGVVLKDANKALLNFLDVPDIKSCRKRYSCICNQFISEEGYISREIDGKNWLDYIIDNPGKEHRVMMHDRHRNENRIFKVSVNRFDETDNYVVSLQDITKLEHEKQHFKIEAMQDHLTNFYNKRAFEHYLADKIACIEGFHSEDRLMALVIFDIDNFKNINDKYGHNTGDTILKKVAELVHSMIRNSDFFARWGGDEFVIVMDDIKRKNAYEIIEKIRKAISEYTFPVPESITCSFGITFLQKSDTIEDALARADRLLYGAKEAGKNRVETDFGKTDEPEPKKTR